MDTCDCCGRKVDERSMENVKQWYVCQACAGTYSEEELIEKITNE
jgi:hypothetical protein